jgi:hypothetical protein
MPSANFLGQIALNHFALTYLFSPTFGTAADPQELGIGMESRF